MSRKLEFNGIYVHRKAEHRSYSAGKGQVAIFWYVKYLKLKDLHVIKVHGCGM